MSCLASKITLLLMRPFISVLAILSLTACLLIAPATQAQSDLPSLGDSTSSIVSLQQERELGQHFLRSIRAQVPTVDDPIIQDYLEHLTYRLAAHSQLTDRRLDLVIIRNPTINAFAAPGGIIGVNHGLFLNMTTEHELAAILAHELAHLSQRHFARQMQEGRRAGAVSLGSVLAGIILAATAGSDAALAAMASGQGYAQNQFLKYSRERELEADSIGIYTLADAGMDPRAMAYVFDTMQRVNRFSSGNNIPEFLRTHPVTRTRVADAFNKTSDFPQESFPKSLNFELMKIRARVLTSKNLQEDIKMLKARMKIGDDIDKIAIQYGLTLALTRELEFDEARSYIRRLRGAYPLNIPFRIAEAEIYQEAQLPDQSLALFEEALAFTPSNYPISVNYAEALIAARKPHAALELLLPFSLKRPNDEYVWYLMAEAYGLANDIAGVHEARAEFFVLNGNFDQAIKQLGYALPLVRHNFQQSARIKQRIDEIWQLKGDT